MPDWNSTPREVSDSHFLPWEACSWEAAGLGQKSLTSFFVSSAF
jgi:hypothetical protein